MGTVPILCFALMTIAYNCTCVTAEPSELESLKKRLDMLDLRLTYDMLNLQKNLETERRLRILLQSTVHQLQEQSFTTSHTESLKESDILKANLISQQKTIEQLRNDFQNTNYQSQILRNDNTRPQNENNDLRQDIFVLKKAFGEEKESRKQMENIVSDLKSKQEELRLELRKASNQGNEFKMFNSLTEKSLMSLKSDLHHIERKQNALNSSATIAIHKMDAYIDGVSNDVCQLNLSFRDNCQSHGINKSRCCLKVALQSVQEKLNANAQILSDFKSELNFHVSFSARLYPTIQDINPWDTIVFSDVLHNEGSAYNPTNGKFIAPVEGTYVFFSHILGGPRSLETALMINENIKLWLFSGDPTHLAPGSNMLVIRMQKGDSAKMVKHGIWGDRPFYMHHVWSTFSGFLLSVG